MFLEIYQNSEESNFTRASFLMKLLFFNKVADLMPPTLLTKRLWHMSFPVNLAKFLRTHFHTRTPPVAASVNKNFALCAQDALN